MTEILFVLAIAWAVVTLLGHLSWVIVRSVFQVITGTFDRPTTRPVPDENSDLSAARRVILRMTERGLINGAEADEWRTKLRNLEYRQTSGTIHPATPPTSATPPTLEPAAGQQGDLFHDLRRGREVESFSTQFLGNFTDDPPVGP